MSRAFIDAEAIRALAAILAETGLTEIEIGDKDNRIRVARAPAPIAMAAPAPVDGAVITAVTALPAAAAAVADISKHPGAVLSPMVGVAYLAPEPGQPPYVTVGQSVSVGQTLLLIEAMKTFNQIKAPKAGTVSQILIGTGSPVEYGEVLVVLE